MKKILLTGSNGFLGQHIAKQAWLNENIEITGWSASAPIHDFCNYFNQLDFKSTHYWEEEIKKYDLVIHTAALSQIDYCENNREEAFLVNTEASRRIATACKKWGKQLIHISTDFVFQGNKNGYTENDQTSPVNFYGRTKEAAEIYIKNILHDSIIIRPVLIYGNVLSGTRSNLVLWVKKALKEGQKIKVVTNHFRTPTFVNDLAQLCINAANSPTPGTYHACGTDYYSIYDIAKIVANHYNLDASLIDPVHSNEINAPGIRPEKTKFNALKSIETFGFNSRTINDCLAIMDKEKEGFS